MQFVAKHELTHFIEKRVGKQQYFDLMNTIFDSDTFKKWYQGKGFKNLTEMEANKVEEYRKGGIDLNGKDKLGAKKEILADFVGEMLFGGKNQISDSLFSELDDNHKKTFREWIGALIDRLKTLFKGNKTAEDEITKLEAKFKEMLKESLKSEAPGETNTVSLNYNNRPFSYNELVSRGNITGVVISKNDKVKFRQNGLIDTQDLIKRVKAKCSTIKTNSSEPTYYVSVPDIGENVEIIADAITHGISRKNRLNKSGRLPQSAVINARVTVDLPNILANSIEVNRSSRTGNIDVAYSHVMLGVTGVEMDDGSIDYYVVRFLVEERVNQNPILVESNILGKLYAANAKKIAPSHAQVVNNNNVALATKRLFEYSIAHLVDDVKGEFNNTFSKDVYTNLGTARVEDEFSANLSYSYTPADEQELTRMAREGEISAEEYGRRMLDMRESKSVDDPYTIAHMKPEDKKIITIIYVMRTFIHMQFIILM